MYACLFCSLPLRSIPLSLPCFRFLAACCLTRPAAHWSCGPVAVVPKLADCSPHCKRDTFFFKNTELQKPVLSNTPQAESHVRAAEFQTNPSRLTATTMTVMVMKVTLWCRDFTTLLSREKDILTF